MEEKYIGFLAGVISGIVKLLVGHPFGTKYSESNLRYNKGPPPD